MKTEEKWLEWAKELQALSQSALAYCRDVYDIERFQRIREISAEMAAALTDTPIAAAKARFINETGYQTPKLDTRAAVIRDGRILLAQERDGNWSLPGGWVDADQSVKGNALKEVLEETGVTARGASHRAARSQPAPRAQERARDHLSLRALRIRFGAVRAEQRDRSGGLLRARRPSPALPGQDHRGADTHVLSGMAR